MDEHMKLPTIEAVHGLSPCDEVIYYCRGNRVISLKGKGVRSVLRPTNAKKHPGF